MTLFASDADLLGYEPNVFVELPFPSQRRLRVTDAALSGAMVASATGGFEGLAADAVVVLEVSAAEKSSHAIASVEDDNTLTLGSVPGGLSETEGLTLEVRTLRPQMEKVHERLMRAIGVDVDDPEETLTEASVVSVQLMRRLEALGTLGRAYAAGMAMVGKNEGLASKSDQYLKRFRRAIRGARVLIDADGDGRAERWRTPGVSRLVRI
jgi:hypothetical protein